MATKEQIQLARLRRELEAIYPLRSDAISVKPDPDILKLKLRRTSPVPTKTPSLSIFDRKTKIGKTAGTRRRGGKI